MAIQKVGRTMSSEVAQKRAVELARLARESSLNIVKRKCQERMRDIMSLPVPDMESARIQTQKVNVLQEVTEWIEAEKNGNLLSGDNSTGNKREKTKGSGGS